MSKRREANPRMHSREGQPLLSKWQQVPQRVPQTAAEVTWVTVTPLYGVRPVPRLVNSSRPSGRGTQEDSLEGGHSVPLSGTVKRTPRLSVSDLPPLHGPPLKVTPPWQLSLEKPRATSARLKLPPLPAAPESSERRPRAQSRGVVASRYRDLVPPSLLGSMAADRSQETLSLCSTDERLWRRSAARHGHHLPPLRHSSGLQLCTGTQPAWTHLRNIKTEDLSEVQEAHGGKTTGDMFRDLAQENSSLCQEADAEPQVLRITPGLPEGFTGEMGKFSELLTPGLIAEPCSGSDNSCPRDPCLKEPEEKWEDKDFLNTNSSEDGDNDTWGMSLAPLKEERAETVPSPLAGEPWDDEPSELFPTSEAEESPGFSASSSSGGTCEERGTRWPAEQGTHGTDSKDALKSVQHIKAEELEELEEDILSSLHEKSILTSYSLCTLTSECPGETENYSQLVPPDLFAELWSLFNNKDMPCWDSRVDELLAKWEEKELPERDAAADGDNESEWALRPALQDKETEPAASLGGDPSGDRHSEPLPMELPNDLKMSFCTLPAIPTEDPDAACLEAGCSQARFVQENRSGAVVLAGACPVPCQPLACCVLSPTDKMATYPQPQAPRQRRSLVKRARRALRRLFSFSCLRGQPEE